ncbi:MAG TPA: F0F1 ATP synthase subunit B' [Thermohalobaculum sp.]|nr:F0F1 ATP synthase subunit B' [Thermohalobaculum sp.]
MATPTDAGAAAEHGANGASGLPQLDFTSFPSQIFWLVVACIVLFQLMTKVALPRIAGVLEERADAIADELDRAEEFRRKAAEAEEAYEQALADARSKAQAIAAETRAELQGQVDEAMAKADAEISARTAESEKRIDEIRESAAVAVREVAREAAAALIERLMPEAMDQDAVKSAVESRVAGGRRKAGKPAGSE